MKAEDKVLLGLCGSILLITQFVAVREIGSTFFSTEIITLLAVVTILIGPSIAYAAAPRINTRFLTAWGILTFFSLITLPFSIRVIVALSSSLEKFTLLILFLTGGLLLSGFFAIFLPLRTKTEADFKTLYTLELAGAVIGLFIIAALPALLAMANIQSGWYAVLISFWFMVLAAVHLCAKNNTCTALAALMVMLVTCLYPQLDRHAAQLYYSRYWKLKSPDVLETRYSPYQRIDVVQSANRRNLFLDGVPYYNADDLSWFNYYIADVPGRLLEKTAPGATDRSAATPVKRKALVVGSGSMGSSRCLLDQGFDVTTVELDKDVALLGLKYFAGNDARLKLVFDDIRRFIRAQRDESYDLVVLDVPAPYHIQTALLYTPDFFQSARRCLKNGGIVSICACSDDITDELACSITSGAAKVFEHVTGVRGNTAGLNFLYCSRESVAFADKQLAEVIGAREKGGFIVYDDQSIRTMTKDKLPHDRDRLVALLVLSRWMLEGAENE